MRLAGWRAARRAAAAAACGRLGPGLLLYATTLNTSAGAAPDRYAGRSRVKYRSVPGLRWHLLRRDFFISLLQVWWAGCCVLEGRSRRLARRLAGGQRTAHGIGPPPGARSPSWPWPRGWQRPPPVNTPPTRSPRTRCLAPTQAGPLSGPGILGGSDLPRPLPLLGRGLVPGSPVSPGGLQRVRRRRRAHGWGMPRRGVRHTAAAAANAPLAGHPGPPPPGAASIPLSRAQLLPWLPLWCHHLCGSLHICDHHANDNRSVVEGVMWEGSSGCRLWLLPAAAAAAAPASAPAAATAVAAAFPDQPCCHPLTASTHRGGRLWKHGAAAVLGGGADHLRTGAPLRCQRCLEGWAGSPWARAGLCR